MTSTVSVQSASNQPASKQPASKQKPEAVTSALGYQKSDAEIVDYQIWHMRTPKRTLAMRGPSPASLKPKDFCASIGAADTFGRFVAQPYPQLLGEALGISSLNLGFSGVGPSFYNQANNKTLIKLINNAKFVTISCFSGRSQENSRFKTTWQSQERYLLEDGQTIPADYAYQRLLEECDRPTVMALVEETRARYLDEFIQLLEKITVPKVLLWFSKRSPDYKTTYDTVLNLMGGFPHLVNRNMLEILKPYCDEYVEYVDTVGLPQPLINRTTQQPVSIVRSRDYQQDKVLLTSSVLTHNRYYPSPEMHADVARALVAVCQKFA